MSIKKAGREDAEWVSLAQDMHKWLAIVNTVMNIWVTEIRDIFWVHEDALASQKGLWSIALVSQ